MKIRVTLHGGLRDLIYEGTEKSGEPVFIEFPFKRSIKDLIQSLGIPHTEWGEIYLSGKQGYSSDIINEGDFVDVFKVSNPSLPLGNPLFICDVHLRKLAKRLRLLGFDTLFNPKWDDAYLAAISHEQNRILLSRDRGLLMRNSVNFGHLIHHIHVLEQVTEVINRWNLLHLIKPFSRCILCNQLLESVPIDSCLFESRCKPQIPPRVFMRCTEYQYCTQCDKTFWKGTHFLKLKEFCASIESS